MTALPLRRAFWIFVGLEILSWGSSPGWCFAPQASPSIESAVRSQIPDFQSAASRFDHWFNRLIRMATPADSASLYASENSPMKLFLKSVGNRPMEHAAGARETPHVSPAEPLPPDAFGPDYLRPLRPNSEF